VKSQYIAIVSTILLLSGCSTQRVQTHQPQNPLVIAECPELGKVSHKTFGDIVTAYLALLEQYHRCRAAEAQPKSDR
jgi:hypothetical protein